MVTDKTTPSETVTRKPDDDVGTSGSAPTGGGHQTAQQAAITEIGAGGRTDADRHRETRETDGEPGRNPVPIGGASSGHADQASTAGGKVAQGHYKVEKER